MKSTDDLKEALKKSNSPSDFIAENSGSMLNIGLSKYLNTLFSKYSLIKKDIVNHSGLNSTYAYQIINGTRNPRRDKLMQIILSMHITREEADRLLKLANVSVLYEKVARDCFLIYAIEHGMSVTETDDLLDKNGCPTLIDDK